ncbi:hypothetical protein KFL_004660080 [Klebsormidium nitens]|uniref:Uncharacterized protein n=1 Tax=Klebsormidium nitens TaxID=105231 RepID=A0A1Y1IJG7_KLENI|nr:hypothetical protein KFL_004660080 [Klebsormidium nitens]|eukprot:GAQ88876.1 hypothetical protein KFL_004660080 [Klebsormidium nitens]
MQVYHMQTTTSCESWGSSPALAQAKRSFRPARNLALTDRVPHHQQTARHIPAKWFVGEFHWQHKPAWRHKRTSVQAQVQDARMPPQANKRMAPEVRSQEMVDPVVAKQLALVQLEQRRKSSRFAKERQKEELNGALALLGVAAGLAAEANTGKTICDQVLGVLDTTGLMAVWQWIIT